MNPSEIVSESRGASFDYALNYNVGPDRAWDALARQGSRGSVYFTSAWMAAWAETLGCAERVMIARVRRGGELVGLAAWVAHDGIVRFAGGGPTDYHDVLLADTLDDDTAVEVVHRLLRLAADATPGFRGFRLSRLRPQSRFLQLLPRSRFYCALTADVSAPQMAMSHAHDALRKHSLRRHARALARRGVVRFTTYRAARDVHPRLDAFFEQHVARWAGTSSPSLFRIDANRAFYRSLTAELARIDALRYSELCVDQRLAAAHFGFLLDGCFSWYKPCFDPALARYSPGEVMLKCLIEEAVYDGVETFDFTIGDEAFKRRFATACPLLMRADVTLSPVRYAARQSWFALRTLATRLHARRASAS